MVSVVSSGRSRSVFAFVAIAALSVGCAEASLADDGDGGGASADARVIGPIIDAGQAPDARRTADARPIVTVDAAPPPPDAVPPPDAAPPPPDAMPVAFPGGTTTWVGDYDCVQGKTALTLELTHNSTDDSVTGTFSFSEHASNPGTLAGSYSVGGNYNPNSARLVLNPVAWINEPEGYSMVGVTGDLDDSVASATRLSGTVETSGCSTFDVVLQP